MAKVVIRSKSLISCSGDSLESSWESLWRHSHCFREIRGLPVGLLSESTIDGIYQILAREKGYDPLHGLASLAARQLLVNKAYTSKTGCILGSSRGATTSLQESIIKHADHLDLDARTSPRTTAGSLPASVLREFSLEGLQYSVSAACTSGLHAIGSAFALIKGHIQESIIAGGIEFSANDFTVEMLARAGVYTRVKNSSWPHMPLHRDRSGMTLSDGAALVLLESVEEVNSSEVEIIAYSAASESLTLTGVSSDAKALQKAIKSCLLQAGISREEISFIVAHGASTKKGDAAEYRAIEKIFNSNIPPLIYHKWLLGHSLGAASAMSVVLACKHLETNKLSPHPYLPSIDEINSSKRQKNLNLALILAMGFGGNCAAMIIRRQ